jgi:hypothetical protein
VAAAKRHRAEIDFDPVAGSVEQEGLGVGDARCPRDLLREELSGPTRLLRRDDRRELAAAHVSDALCRSGIRPADHTGLIDHVARDADVFECGLDVALERLQTPHALSLPSAVRPVKPDAGLLVLERLEHVQP